MQLHFNTISEPGKPGKKWQKLFNTYWPAYQAWYNSKGASYTPDLETSQAALKNLCRKCGQLISSFANWQRQMM